MGVSKSRSCPHQENRQLSREMTLEQKLIIPRSYLVRNLVVTRFSGSLRAHTENFNCVSVSIYIKGLSRATGVVKAEKKDAASSLASIPTPSATRKQTELNRAKNYYVS